MSAARAKLDLVRSIGADHVIDYSQDDFAKGEKRYDLILDIGGNTALSRLRRALTPEGTLVIAGGEDGGRWIGMDRQLRALALSPFVGQRLTTFGPKEHHTVLERLTELIENGQLVPVIEQTLKGANIRVASSWGEGWEDRRHGLLIPPPRCARSVRCIPS